MTRCQKAKTVKFYGSHLQSFDSKKAIFDNRKFLRFSISLASESQRRKAEFPSVTRTGEKGRRVSETGPIPFLVVPEGE
jgi:hypothetical protein